MKKMIGKKISKGLYVGLLVTFFLNLLFTVGPTEKAYALSYDFTDPIATGCAYKSLITYETKYIYKSGVQIGYVQLKGSAYCHTAWGYIKLYSAAPYDNYANVYLDGFYGTTRRAFTSCYKGDGGNGAVMNGQTSCYTGQLYDKDPYKASASAYIYTSTGAIAASATTNRY
ncbi:DUF2690 domain-containing protein [Paenibacillus caui]|uniref:DUF2690 domain-containing protein n=1 Tax=Paenibacillus caui TaxID=2873927 RepID=UPI001CA81153|nr:DUF2690 domain-containing protein [Paenibacillus caui]